MLMFKLAISCLTTTGLPLFMDLTFHVPLNIVLYNISLYLTNRYNHHWVSFPLWHSHFILSEVISNCPLLFFSSILDTFLPHLQKGSHLQVSYHFAFSYCSWSSLGKNPGTGCHFLLQWAPMHHNSSLWLVHLGWSCMAWLIASLRYAIPLVMTRLWSMKENRRHSTQ